MKKIIILFLFSSIAIADEFVQFDNGATGWRNNAGVVYGVSGGVDNGSHGFNDFLKKSLQPAIAGFRVDLTSKPKRQLDQINTSQPHYGQQHACKTIQSALALAQMSF